MVTPAVWGPTLWTMLHGIGYMTRHAPTINTMVTQDQLRETTWLCTHLITIIPCAECRRHLITYMRERPLPTSLSEFGQWIWTFHEAVNVRLGKPPGPPYTAELGYTNVLAAWDSYKTSIKDSIATGKQKGTAVVEFTRHLHVWNSFM